MDKTRENDQRRRMVVRESAGSLTRRIVEAVARGLRLMGTPSGPVRVLIVDDISETRELLGKLLSYSPMVSVVGLAAHGWDALAQLRRTQPDVALVDIYMPVVAGDQLVAVMSERFPATKAIILTVASSDYCGLDTVEAAIENGAVAYVHKPPSGDRLGQVIHDAGRASRKWTWFCPNPSRPVYAYTGQLGPEAELIRLEGSFGENGPRSIAGLWITEGLAASWPEGNIRLGKLTEVQLDGILGLDLSLTDVSDSEMGTLPQLGNLKTLLLLDTKVGSEGAEFLLRYPRLEVLSVRACAVSEHTLSILSRLPPLRLLDLSDVSLKDSATTRVAGLPLDGMGAQLLLEKNEFSGAGLEEAFEGQSRLAVSLQQNPIDPEVLASVEKKLRASGGGLFFPVQFNYRCNVSGRSDEAFSNAEMDLKVWSEYLDAGDRS